jgi:hypothetical protein
MAGVFLVLGDYSFTSTNTIEITHNLNRVNFIAKVLVDSENRADLIDSIEFDDDDPRNKIIITLASSQTGKVVLFDADAVSVGNVTPAQKKSLKLIAGSFQVVTAYSNLPSSPIHGDLIWAYFGDYNGQYYWDENASAWLSVQSVPFCFFRSGATPSSTVSLECGDYVYYNETGHAINRAATVMELIGTVESFSSSGTDCRFQFGIMPGDSQNETFVTDANKSVLVEGDASQWVNDRKNIYHNITKYDRIVARRLREGVYNNIHDVTLTVLVKWRIIDGT